MPQELIIVMLRPWSTGTPPPGIIAPSPAPKFKMDCKQVREASTEQTLILVPGTLADAEEWTAVEQLLPILGATSAARVFVNLLFPPGMELTQEENNRTFVRYERLLSIGVEDVLIDSPSDPGQLLASMRLSQSVMDLNTHRMEMMLSTEPEPVTEEELERQKSRHRHLLWESVPRALMPCFPPVNATIAEGPKTVGRYRLVSRLESTSGRVLLAASEDQGRWEAYAIKVIEKDSVKVIGELECVYREYRFLSAIVQHPHVARCLEMLHSPARIHLVFELAGSINVGQALNPRPGQRFSEKESLDILGQTGSAVGYCHSLNISHRELSLEHIVLRGTGPDAYHCTVVDFNKATLARPDTTSQTVCGKMPCIAPEVATGRTYVPWRADCWSMGVVLLEMAGGKGSMCHFLGCDDKPTRDRARAVARKEHETFAVKGSHARALAKMGAVECGLISTRLELLLQPVPLDRAPLRKVLNGLKYEVFSSFPS